MELVVDKNLITFGSVLISVKGYMNTKIRYKILKLIDAVILLGISDVTFIYGGSLILNRDSASEIKKYVCLVPWNSMAVLLPY